MKNEDLRRVYKVDKVYKVYKVAGSRWQGRLRNKRFESLNGLNASLTAGRFD